MLISKSFNFYMVDANGNGAKKSSSARFLTSEGLMPSTIFDRGILF